MKQWDEPRVVIEDITPAIDCGRFPVKRVVGESIRIEANVFADGHEELAVLLLHKREDEKDWQRTLMEPLGNDRWGATFNLSQVGEYLYTVMAWVDVFKTWRTRLMKRLEAGQDVSVELLTGADLLERVAARADTSDADRLRDAARALRTGDAAARAAVLAADGHAAELTRRNPDVSNAATALPALRVAVDRPRAGFSAWYEVFPRSCAMEAGRHGTFKDCEAMLPYIATMGFDVLYLPPIHPIGETARKGRNNSVCCEPEDPGTPWAIGSLEGGHKAIHPLLGSLEDFRSLVSAAKELGLEVALDIAFQCSPDHPWVREHPDWFRWRPDGTVQYAENPPKKYQDIYPLEFDGKDREGLWLELHSVVRYWIDQGVRIFRVDNPHTKPFAFWEWLISSLKEQYPDLIFLSEAFTRPHVMAWLAKLGFAQSYTYFTWRRTKWELIEYITELTRTELAQYFRPNFWPNTPDILMDYLQEGGRPAFQARLVLAATLSSNYGVYGPAFELCVNAAREPDSEEYLNSEKYELKHWNLASPESIAPLIAQVNRIRNQSRALQQTRNIHVQHVDNDMLLAYCKWDDASSDHLLIVVNMDPHHVQAGWVTLDPSHLPVPLSGDYTMHDLLTNHCYIWSGLRNYVSIDPTTVPAHILRIGMQPEATGGPGRS